MITEKLCKEIQKDWNGKIYQKWDKEWKRFEHLNKLAPFFKERKVLEIGCNGGVESLEICNYCKSYVGIEPKKEYFNQAHYTMKRAKCKQVVIINTGLRDFMSKPEEFDTLFTSFVMYHLKDDEVEILKKDILPRINTWILYNRTKDRKIKNNSYVFEDPKNTIEFVKQCGFKMDFEWQKEKIWYYIKATR